MATREFKIGDNVRLKSGGPQMTIIGLGKKNEAECCWFDDDGKERRTKLPEAAVYATPPAELSEEQLKAAVAEMVSKKSKSETKGWCEPE